MDRVVAEALKLIADDLARARAEIRALRPDDLRRESLPAAGAELEAIVRDTEAATHAIMEAAEAMLAHRAADVDAYRAFVEAQATAVFEACAFQDITGQRVAKIVSVLNQVEARVGRLADAFSTEELDGVETAEDRRRRELILHGPGLHGPDNEQTAIDAILDGPTSSQDDIDALFTRP